MAPTSTTSSASLTIGLLASAALAVAASASGCTKAPPQQNQARAPDPAADPAAASPRAPASAASRPTSTARSTPTTFRALSDDEVARQVTPALRDGETLAHRAFRGPFGPGSETVFVVVSRRGDVGGFVLVPPASGAGALERVDLPAISEGSLEDVDAVAFVDADHDRAPDAVIMTRQMTGAGPQGAIPRPFNFVIAWNGRAFSRLPQAEQTIADLATMADVEAALSAPADPAR